MENFENLYKNNKIDSILDNYLEFKELIINYLEVNNRNLIKIKNDDFNIYKNSEFYAYIIPTNYKINKLISYLIGILYGKYNYDYASNFDMQKIKYINEVLDLDGIYIHNELIHDNICDNIIYQLNKKDYFQNWKNNIIFSKLDIFNSMQGTLWINNQKDVITINEIQKIVSDPFI